MEFYLTKIRQIFLLVVCAFLAFSCEKNEIKSDTAYSSALSFTDESADFPEKIKLEALLDDYLKKGILGISLAINTPEGTWLGAGGYADLASGIKMEKGHSFFIASISKVITATSVFTYIDQGLLSLDDPVNKWIDKEVCDQIANANDAKISDLLSHQSGIKDWYVIALEMARFNEEANNWKQEDILSYVYGKDADFAVGENYGYSNTNYVLLGMILEKVSGMTLGQVYENAIFQPLGLNSATYVTQEAFDATKTVKGYMDMYGTGEYVETAFLYRDEMGTGDGGISINAQDLSVFMQSLINGALLNESSMAAMQNWFEISGYGEQVKNGYGLEYFEDDFGTYIGHTGGVDGFSSFAFYYPGSDVHFTLLMNYSPNRRDWELLQEFFEEIKTIILD